MVPDENRPRFSVLIVDDEAGIRDLMIQILSTKYTVYSSPNATEARRVVLEHNPDLVIVDIYMPGDSGIVLCRDIREDPASKHIPVIIMTARNARETRVKAFESGADDFLEKPFHMDELISRVDSKLKRVVESKFPRLTINAGDLTLDLESLEAELDGEAIEVKQLEFRILSILMKNLGKLVTRKVIEADIWGNDLPSTRSLDTHMATIRRKLSRSKRLVMRTVYGEGFVLETKK